MKAEIVVAEPGRLDAVLAEATGAPRADVQRALVAGRVTVDGELRPKSFRLRGGETVVIDIPDDAEIEADARPVEIRFDDEHLFVIDKPAGLVTHPTRGRRSNTLVNRLLGLDVALSGVGGTLRPGIVHRLDAGTSGLMIIAHTDPAHEALAAMMKRHDIDRRYLALVRGEVEHDAFAVDAPLGRRGDRVVVDRTEGREAETAFEVRERFESMTLLEAAPRTGRTHQIRVHLKAVGHPILGDRAYGGGGHDAARLGLERPFLHSWRLAFDHPITGQRVEVEQSLPEDLAEVLERVRGQSDDLRS